MSDVQRSILHRKIATAEARSAAENARAAEAGEALAAIFDEYFRTKLKPSPLRSRTLDKTRLTASPLNGAWFLFHRGDADLVVGFDKALVAASVDIALMRGGASASDREPTAIDRSIAAALAGRIAGTLARLGDASPSAETQFVQAATLAADLKLDKASATFDVYESFGVPVSTALRVDVVCAIAASGVGGAVKKAAPGADWRQDLSRIGYGAPVALDAALGRIHTTIGAMIDLSEGAVLSIDEASIDKIQLGARGSGRSVLSGRLGAASGRRAVKIEPQSP